MKIILPVAGEGTRLRPHTYSKAKSLLHVAGNTVLGHIINKLLELEPESFIFIVDQNGDQIKNFVEKNYPNIKAEYTVQKERKGPAHAIWMAKPFINENDDILIVYNDTMFITDLNKIKTEYAHYDGLVYVKKTDDPERFGIIVLEDGKIKNIVEKPKNFIGDLAVVGMYYMKDGIGFMNLIQETIEKNMTERGEFYLNKPLLLAIERGAKLGAPEIREWLDCGKPETLLDTNKYLLSKGCSKKQNPDGNVIIDPVYIEDDVKIENSIIGPYVSIGSGCVIKDSIIKNTIIGTNTRVIISNLEYSVIGDNVFLRGATKKLNIGDNCEMI